MVMNDIQFMYDIGRIEREMLRQFLSREKLAKKAGIAPSTVSRIFNTGTGTAENIGKLVTALGIDPDEVVVFREKIELPTEAHVPVAKTQEATGIPVATAEFERIA